MAKVIRWFNLVFIFLFCMFPIRALFILLGKYEAFGLAISRTGIKILEKEEENKRKKV